MPLFLEVLSLGLILSADSFSAAIAMGNRRFTGKDLMKFALASSGAEAISTLIGYLAGAKLNSVIAHYDHWIAFGLLALVSLHMFFEAFQQFRESEHAAEVESPHSFAKILMVSFATSMDAFGVGIGLGLANRPVTPFLGSIAAWAFVATVVGVKIGNRLSRKFGPIFTFIAAIVLAYLSVQTLSI